ncbi:MAG TPA: phosphoglucomutase/phosphomannomutase family protein, partial [Saprospiraceae bacterium]|nr:phosphoglucomutase/phosphomannomutase family protein [Saprospiraceae bacterium]
ANDGDADRIGMYDDEGNFVDSHHLLLLLLLYLHKYKGMTGEVIVTFSVTDKMKKMAELFGLPFTTKKIGFKYIAEFMLDHDVLVGGEESGGLAVKGHIPERDGIWIGLTIMEFMAKTGKSIRELIREVYDLVGAFSTDRYDLHITEEQKQSVIKACKENLYKTFGKYQVSRVEDLDGYKYYLDDERWVMIRPSGTEPVLRVYSQAPTHEEAIEILEQTKKTILA